MARNHFNAVLVRPDYPGPASYYSRRVDVGVRSVTTCKTGEGVASLTVGFLGVTTSVTFPRCVPRFDVADRYPNSFSFVADLQLKICKSPRMQETSPRLGSPYPQPDAVEILESNTERGAFSRSDDLLGNAMIHVSRKATLLTSPLAKQSLRAFSALLLEALSQSTCSITNIIQVCAGKVLPVTSGSNVDDTNIYTEPAKNLFFLNVRNIDGDEEVEPRATDYEASFAALEAEKCSLVISAYERNCLAARDCPDVRCIASPRENVRVVCDPSKWTKVWLCFLVEFVSSCHLSDRANDHLRGQIGENRSCFVVGNFVQRKLSEDLSVPRLFRQPVTCFVCSPHCRDESRRLFGRRQELHLHNKLHHSCIAV